MFLRSLDRALWRTHEYELIEKQQLVFIIIAIIMAMTFDSPVLIPEIDLKKNTYK